MSYSPLISIIIPTYNRADVLPQTLDSVLNQTYQNWECIVVDDGSRDNTAEILERYAVKDKRINFYKRPEERKPGGNGARNYGFLKSFGEYVKWLDSDDLITPKLLEYEVERINSKNPEAILTHWKYFDSENNSFPERNKLVLSDHKNGIDLLNKMGELGDFSFPSCYLIKREIIFISGLWNEHLKINQDGDFFFRVLVSINNLESIPYLGSLHRKDGENKISQKYDALGFEKRLQSWIFIESQIKIMNTVNLERYIDGTKTILYNELKSRGLLELILKYHDFFKKNIKNERSRKVKIKFFLQKF